MKDGGKWGGGGGRANTPTPTPLKKKLPSKIPALLGLIPPKQFVQSSLTGVLLTLLILL